MADNQRSLPNNLEAERSVLGAILIENAALNEALPVINARAFFRDAHRRIFEAMVELSDKRQPIDLTTLKELLEQKGDLEEVGGPAYIASLVDGVPRSTNIEYYAQIVKDKATLRSLIFSANKILGTAYEADQSADLIVDEAEAAIMAVGELAIKGGEFVQAEDWMSETSEQVEKAYNDKRIVTGVTSGIEKLDGYTRGWQPSDLIYIGARPSAGKTSLMLQMALSAAAAGTMAGVISLEMSRKVIGMRAVSMVATVDAFRLMVGHLTPFEKQRVNEAMLDIARRKIAIDDAVGMSATQLRAKVRRFASRRGIGALFVDYMQLVYDQSIGAENRNQELAQISAGWKSLARELNIPVIVLSQLSRGNAKENRRPQVSDLRDSGALEQDADVAILLHRPQQNEHSGSKYQDGEEAEIIIGKQRNGPTGLIRLQWVGPQMRFAALEEKVDEPKQETLV